MNSEDDQFVALLCLAAAALGGQYLHNKRKYKRRWGVRPINRKRLQQGDYDNLLQEMRLGDEDQFFIYTRMTPARFDLLLSIVGPLLQKTSKCQSLSPGFRLAVTLRFLATGDSFQSIAWSFRIGRSTTCTIVNETTRAIWESLSPVYLQEPTEAGYLEVAKGFEDRWNFPNCVGAIDGKHVVIQAPPNSGSQFYNYKNQFSIVLLAVCDSDYIFTHVDVGAYGSQSDGGIFRLSEFGRRLNDGSLQLPPPSPLPSSQLLFPHFMVGDEAFALESNMMRPYPGKNLSKVKQVYNYRLSRARRTIENAFGILVARWRVYHRVIIADPPNIDSIIKSTVCLHNYLKILDRRCKNRKYCPPAFSDRDNCGQLILGDWRAEVQSSQGSLQSINTMSRRLGSRNNTLNATALRDRLAEYLYSPMGAVDWQMPYINRGIEIADF